MTMTSIPPAAPPGARLFSWGAACLTATLKAFGLCLLVLSVQTPARAQVVWEFGFADQTDPWTVFGDGGRIERMSEPAALGFHYRLDAGQIQLLSLPVPRGRLDGVQGLEFSARADHDASVVLSMEEQGGGRWSATFTLSRGDWRPVRLNLADFVLSVGAQDPADDNGRLDVDRVQQLSLVDAASFVANVSPAAMGFFGLEAGDRILRLRDLRFLSRPAAPRVGPPSLAGFDTPQPMWMVLGAERVEFGAAGPLRSPGLALTYERRFGRAMSAMRRVPLGLLDGTRALTLTAASTERVQLVVKLEQADGGRFEAKLPLQSGGPLKAYRLDSAAFTASDDNKRGVDRLEWAKVTQLNLVEAGGLLGPGGRNQLWLADVSAEGADLAASKPAPGRAAEPATETVATAGWSRWTKRLRAVRSGPYSLVGDPSVMRDGKMLRMVYNCFDPKRKRGAICESTSADGLDWTDVDTGDSLPGRLIKTRPGEWDDAQETPFLFKFRDEYLLYFVGYRDRGGFMKSFPAYVGLAVSEDGVNFRRPDTEPVLRTTSGGYDNDSISSPSVVEFEGEMVMLYTAHCWTKCPLGKGLTLMAATSRDGRNWVKRTEPVLRKRDFPHAKDGIAEAEVSRAPDGRYYLFYSLLYGDDGHEIGVASAPSPFGPWDINPQPIVRKSAAGFDDIGPIAPTVVYDGDRVRMWFHGFSKRRTIQIGYAEAPWPLKTR